MGVGESKIWFDPAAKDKLTEALTRDDVRALIKDGVIKAKPKRGVCRVRARERHEGKKKGRHSGHGSRKGTKNARNNPKEQWIAKVRAQRKIIALLAEAGSLDRSNYRAVYMRIKGNSFKGKKTLLNYLKENNFVSEEQLNKTLTKSVKAK